MARSSDFLHDNHIICKQKWFHFHLSELNIFYLFCLSIIYLWFVMVLRTSGHCGWPLWNCCDFREHLFLALKLRTKASRFLSFSKDDTYTFSVFLFNIIRLFIFSPNLPDLVVNEGCILSNGFSVSTWLCAQIYPQVVRIALISPGTELTLYI